MRKITIIIIIIIIIILIIIKIITYIALTLSGGRAQKCNKTKSLIIFKSRGHTGQGHHQFEGPLTI